MSTNNNLNKNKSRASRYRFTVGRFFQVLIGAIFIGFSLRFLYIGLASHINGVNLTQKTNEKYQQNIVLKASRGSIFDRNGQVIAEDSHVYSIYAVLDKSYVDQDGKAMYVKDKKETARALSQYIDLSAEEIYKYLTPKKKTYQVEFGNAGQNLSLETKKQIEKLKLPGIFFNDSPSRLYPNGVFASNQVGLAQKSETKKNTLVGTMGIEKYFNKELSGTDGLKEAKIDSYGYELPNAQRVLKPAKDGDDVYLTLDSRYQTYLEDLMTTAFETYEPVKMTAVLMEAKTGKIMAASERPTFNPTTKEGLSDSWRDTLIEDVYEPGSVFKILTLGSAIENGVYKPNENYQSGSVSVLNYSIRDWNYTGWGMIPFSQAFPRSSNVGMVKLVEKIGESNWKKTLEKARIGKATGVTLPGEATGNVSIKSELDSAVTSFGQGVNVNVMQMMQILSALGNNGQMIKPQLVEKITTSEDKKVSSYQRKTVGEQLFSADTTKTILENMKNVVNEEYGTGRAYQIEGQDIAVKTGTAQLADPNGGGYLTGDNNYIFSVAGVAPASDPKYVLYITMQQPQKMTQAAETIMASVFKPLMKRVLESDSSETAQPAEVKDATVPSLINATKDQAVSQLQSANLNAIVIGDGEKVLKQGTDAMSTLKAGETVMIYLGGEIKMPDMIGWTKDQVEKFTDLTGINVKTTGSGTVTKQSVDKDTVILAASPITVELKE